MMKNSIDKKPGIVLKKILDCTRRPTRRARSVSLWTYNGVPGCMEPPAESRDRAPGQEVRGEVPEAKSHLAFERQKKVTLFL